MTVDWPKLITAYAFATIVYLFWLSRRVRRHAKRADDAIGAMRVETQRQLHAKGVDTMFACIHCRNGELPDGAVVHSSFLLGMYGVRLCMQCSAALNKALSQPPFQMRVCIDEHGGYDLDDPDVVEDTSGKKGKP